MRNLSILFWQPSSPFLIRRPTITIFFLKLLLHWSLAQVTLKLNIGIFSLSAFIFSNQRQVTSSLNFNVNFHVGLAWYLGLMGPSNIDRMETNEKSHAGGYDIIWHDSYTVTIHETFLVRSVKMLLDWLYFFRNTYQMIVSAEMEKERSLGLQFCSELHLFNEKEN